MRVLRSKTKTVARRAACFLPFRECATRRQNLSFDGLLLFHVAASICSWTLLKQLTRLQTYRCSIPTRTQQAPTCCVRPSIPSQMPRLHVQSIFNLRLRQSSCTVDVTYSPSLTPRTANYSRPRSVEMDGTPYYILMVCGDLVTLLLRIRRLCTSWLGSEPSEWLPNAPKHSGRYPLAVSNRMCSLP